MNTLDGATYTYDHAGNRTSKSNLLNSTTSNYTYDNVYQLTGVTAPNPESYTYDPVGNRLTSQNVPSYTYNSSNELTTAGSATYTYDDNGNMLTKTDAGGTTTYNWDFENHLTSVQLPNSISVNFIYDPFGHRIQKGSSVFMYDGATLIQETSIGGALVARYVFGAGVDEPIAAYRGTVSEFYDPDGLGTVTSLGATAGILSDSFTYDSFGNLLGSSGSFIEPFRYTGREWDNDIGLYYYRARYYSPMFGRFISEDPLGFGGSGPNSYVYTLNSPTNIVDPSGLQGTSTGTTTAWTAEEQAAYQAFVRQLEHGRLIRGLGKGLVIGALIDANTALAVHDYLEGRKLLQAYGVIAPDLPFHSPLSPMRLPKSLLDNSCREEEKLLL